MAETRQTPLSSSLFNWAPAGSPPPRADSSPRAGAREPRHDLPAVPSGHLGGVPKTSRRVQRPTRPLLGSTQLPNALPGTLSFRNHHPQTPHLSALKCGNSSTQSHLPPQPPSLRIAAPRPTPVRSTTPTQEEGPSSSLGCSPPFLGIRHKRVPRNDKLSETEKTLKV